MYPYSVAGREGRTPKVTMRSSAATSRASRQTLANASGSETTWSAASATTTASPSSAKAKAVPATIAGPESRRAGSSRICASVSIAASCSATRKRYWPLVTTIGRPNNSRIRYSANGFLERRIAAKERQKLLWPVLARRRPEPGAGAATHNEGDDQSSQFLHAMTYYAL